MTRSFRTLIVVAAACVVAAGCGSDASVAPVSMASIAGTYNLKSYNGLTVPAVIQATNPKVEVLDDQVIVRADGTWSENGNFRLTDLSGTTIQNETGSGTYTLNGATASFRDGSDGSVTTAIFSGDTFTVVDGGATLIYAK